MRTPERLIPLVHAHLIDEVVGQLQSGKEAEVYVVRSGENYLCAKIYKAANDRTFKQRSQYTEGRKVRNSRQARAMEKKSSRYGRQEREAEWQNAEVDALYLLAGAGVRVPKPHTFYEGVLLLEMITDSNGYAAPRLNDVVLTAEQARSHHLTIIREAVLMLCAGIVHGDLSEFNILVASDGLVIIDLPQAIQATSNTASAIFERDLNQLAAFFGRFAPEINGTRYPREIWKMYQSGTLKPDSPLTGLFTDNSKAPDLTEAFAEIDDAREEAQFKADRGTSNYQKKKSR